ncbi:MAG: hypothetical protein EOO41_00215 [Methanobacteriota archaeon]|nr:MAG: hypothetical protein EOO41_00215 [Euryarchaeota archaeon]
MRWCADVWDDKITTLPGLYYLAAGVHSVSTALLPGITLPCDTQFLRSLNAGISCVAMVAAILLVRFLFPCAPALRNVAHAAVLATFPIHLFMSHLAYTDTLSVACVLACVAAAVRSSSSARPFALTFLSSVVRGACHAVLGARLRGDTLPCSHVSPLQMGAASVMVRQNNIVWAAYAAGLVLLTQVCQAFSAARPVGAQASLQLAALTTVRALPQLSGFIAVAVVFLVFLVRNGGVAVGDKEQHALVWHWAQLVWLLDLVALYAAAVSILNALARVLHAGMLGEHGSGCESSRGKGGARRARLWRRVRLPHVLVALVSSMMTLYAVEHYAMAHLYVLSDNRHATFYLWRRILAHAHYRRALAVVAGVCVSCLPSMVSCPPNRHRAEQAARCAATDRAATGSGTRHATERAPVVFAAWWLICSALCLVPAHLLELRYFIVPLLLLLAQVSMVCAHRVAPQQQQRNAAMSMHPQPRIMRSAENKHCRTHRRCSSMRARSVVVHVFVQTVHWSGRCCCAFHVVAASAEFIMYSCMHDPAAT